MAKQDIDYRHVISDLEAKRAQINSRFDAAISALRQVMALQEADPQLPFPDVTTKSKQAAGPYRNLSMVDAAMKHIRSVGRAVPNVTLAKALEAGGYEHRSRNFANTLNSILWRRAKTIGDLRKADEGWEVAESD